MSRAQALPLMLVLVIAFTWVFAQPVDAQTLTVLHTFTGGVDGAYPDLGSIDAAGNLYGSTFEGGATPPSCGSTGCGLVFKLAQRNSSWVETILYDFVGGNDGRLPQYGPTFGRDGNLYGTTSVGGNQGCSGGCGIIYKLQPSATVCRSILCPWNETLVHTFTGGSDGALPSSSVSFDQAGNLYGTTLQGGQTGFCGFGCGVVYKVSPSGGGWTESVLYAFTGGTDGFQPKGGVVMDRAGDVYGTSDGPTQNGVPGAVYELTPNGSGYTKSFYYVFPVNGSNGSEPLGLIIDPADNIYGGTQMAGQEMGGTVYELSPGSNGPTFTLLYALTNIVQFGYEGVDGQLIMDAGGNLYGATGTGGQFGMGAVFKLTPSMGMWTYTSLHDFTGGSDGAFPRSVLLDAHGNLFGAADGGGANGYGTVFEITQ